MFVSLKKKITSASVALALCASLACPPAKAIVAVASWNPVLMGIGLGVASGGYLVSAGGGGLAELGDQQEQSWANIGLKVIGYPIFAVGALAAMAGMIVLDASHAQPVVFTPLSAEDGAKLKIPADDLEIYDSELDQANAISANVAADLRTLENPTIQDAAGAWKKYESLVSPATFRAMGKISLQMAPRS